MSVPEAKVEQPFAVDKLKEKVRQFGELLGEILREQEDPEVYQAVEKLRKGYIQLRRQDDPALRNELMEFIAQLEVRLLEKVIRAFNTFYIINNIVEEDFQHRERRRIVQSSTDHKL